jgi:hypothetical protein
MNLLFCFWLKLPGDLIKTYYGVMLPPPTEVDFFCMYEEAYP